MSRLLVAQSASECPPDWEGKLFVLDAEVAKIDDSLTYDVLRTLYDSDVDEVYSVPVYRIIWTHLAANYPNYGSLLELIPLSIRLKEHVESEGVDTVIIDSNVSRHYLSVIKDVCAEQDCQLKDLSEVSVRKRAQNIQSDIWNAIFQPGLLLLNQLLSLFIPNSDIDGRSMVIFPYPGRYDSTLPIARELEDCAECLIPHLGSDVIDWPSVDFDFPLKSYQDHSSISLINNEIRLLVDLLRPKNRNEFSSVLTMVICDKFGVRLPETVRNSVDRVIDQNIRPILYYYWAIDFFKSNNISAVLVGGPSPRELAVLEAAHRYNVDTYYVHHSVTTGDEFLPPQDTIYFVPSETGKSYIESIYDSIDISELCVKGRPYFDERYNEEDYSTEFDGANTSEFVVLAATQPYDDEVRAEFLEQVHQAAAASHLVDEVKVKIHPSETESYYEQLIETLDETEQRISMAGPNLEAEIAQSSLVVTINSNVGLESMIQGAPAVCYNEWHPSIQHKPYTQSSKIPVFDESKRMVEFFESLSADSVHELAEHQQQFAHDQFLAEDSATKAIADEIRRRSLDEDNT